MTDYRKTALDGISTAHSALHQKTKQLHQQYVVPASKYVGESAQSQPIPTALLSLFFITSFFPFLTFALFSLGAFVLFFGTALFLTSIVIGSAALLLVGVLFLTALGSVIALFWIGAGYASYRLLVCLASSNGLKDGIKAFEAEARGIVFGTSAGARSALVEVLPKEE